MCKENMQHNILNKQAYYNTHNFILMTCKNIINHQYISKTYQHNNHLNLYAYISENKIQTQTSFRAKKNYKMQHIRENNQTNTFIHIILLICTKTTTPEQTKLKQLKHIIKPYLFRLKIKCIYSKCQYQYKSYYISH